jgi:hypothetical protein
LEEKLELLGRLMMFSKQMDMVMLSEEAIDHYYQQFVSESDPLVHQKETAS